MPNNLRPTQSGMNQTAGLTASQGHQNPVSISLPAIDAASNRLSLARQELQDVLAALGERLGKVSCGNLDNQVGMEYENIPMSPVCFTIHDEAHKLQDLTSLVRRMIDNLEI